MSDARFDQYMHYGTNAQRLAFTPNPPAVAGIQPLYIWYETDTTAVYVYYTAWFLIINAGAGSAISSLTGDVTATGPGAAAATIAANAVTTAKIINAAVTLAKIANAAANNRVLGSGAAGSGAPYTELTGTQLAVIIDALIGDSGAGGTKGEVPAPSAGDAAAGKFLKADATWAVPSGSGTVTTTGSPANGNLAKFTGATSVSNADLTGDITTSGGVATTLKTAAKTRAITFTIDGGGVVPSTGIKGDISVPYACTITGARLLLDQSGSCVVDIWKDTYANYPPTVAKTITASVLPTVSSATKSDDTTLTGWTTAVAAGDTLRFNLNSVTSATRIVLTLTVTV